ncbi:MAG: hypothetical protein EAZ84_12140 [Verrucomicrobia bacterium]|nr:MAG: hypothetical protein EAZ84_12140 [Verrucomicrobiota bacterium]TAF26579.1 MAG: hypothetical protein EAZ71_05040 [Verrucomicrobiota bacterium]
MMPMHPPTFAMKRKTPQVRGPGELSRTNPCGSAHHHEGEKLAEDYHGSGKVNLEFPRHD